jgi:hypothetical protein
MQLSLPKSPATNPSLRPDHHDTSLARRFGPVAALLAFCKSLDVGRLSSFALTHTPFPRFNRAGPENAAHCRGSGPAGRFVRLPTTSRPLLQRSERPFSHALPCPRTASSSRRDEERTSEMRPNLRGHPCQPVSPRPRSPRSALARRTRAHWVVAECTSASVVVLPTPPGIPETRCLLSSLSLLCCTKRDHPSRLLPIRRSKRRPLRVRPSAITWSRGSTGRLTEARGCAASAYEALAGGKESVPRRCSVSRRPGLAPHSSGQVQHTS